MAAAEQKSCDIVTPLLKAGAPEAAAAADGRTALMCAAACGCVEATKALLAGGARTSTVSKQVLSRPFLLSRRSSLPHRSHAVAVALANHRHRLEALQKALPHAHTPRVFSAFLTRFSVSAMPRYLLSKRGAKRERETDRDRDRDRVRD